MTSEQSRENDKLIIIQKTKVELVELLKNQDAFVLGMSSLSYIEAHTFQRLVSRVKENYYYPPKKSNVQKKADRTVSIQEKLAYIAGIRINVESGYKSQIEVSKRELRDISVSAEDIEGNVKKVIELHTEVEETERNGSVISLIKSLRRGTLYMEIKKTKKTECLQYCLDNFNLARSTYYKYVNLSKLVLKYPSLVFSGKGIQDLVNHQQLIEDAAESDEALKNILSRSLPCIIFLSEECNTDLQPRNICSLPDNEAETNVEGEQYNVGANADKNGPADMNTEAGMNLRPHNYGQRNTLIRNSEAVQSVLHLRTEAGSNIALQNNEAVSSVIVTHIEEEEGSNLTVNTDGAASAIHSVQSNRGSQIQQGLLSPVQAENNLGTEGGTEVDEDVETVRNEEADKREQQIHLTVAKQNAEATARVTTARHTRGGVGTESQYDIAKVRNKEHAYPRRRRSTRDRRRTSKRLKRPDITEN